MNIDHETNKESKNKDKNLIELDQVHEKVFADFTSDEENVIDADNKAECMQLIPEMAKSCTGRYYLCSRHRRFRSLINNYSLLKHNIESRMKCAQRPNANNNNNKSCHKNHFNTVKRSNSFSLLNFLLVKFGCMNIN